MSETFVVIGNGAIGLVCKMLEQGIDNIYLVGPINENATTNKLSASRAAKQCSI